MATTLPQIEFIRRFAKNAGLMQKDAKQYLFFMLDDISRALSSGREVRLQGIGTIKRVCFRSRTMANPATAPSNFWFSTAITRTSKPVRS